MTRDEVVERIWAAGRLHQHRLLAQLRHPEDAADVVQDALLACIKAMDSGIQIRNPEGFLDHVLRCRVSDLLSDRQYARNHLRPIEDARAVAAPSSDILAELDRADVVQHRADLVRDSIEKLNPRYLTVVSRVLDGHEPAAIMADMHLSKARFGLLKSRAAKQLGDRIRRRKRAESIQRVAEERRAA